MNNYLLLILLSFSVVYACKNAVDSTPASQKLTANEDFNRFYKRFHEDTAFQMNRIIWPLEGLPSKAYEWSDEALKTFRWQKDEWIPHKLPDQPIERKFNILNQHLISENIYLNEGKFGMLRRWAKMGDDWYLIYYVGINKVATD